MTRFISYLVDFFLSTFIFASNFVTDCLITFEKKKTRFFSKNFRRNTKKIFRLSFAVTDRVEESRKFRNDWSWSIKDPYTICFRWTKIVILTRHIQGVQKYGIKFFNTKLTYFQKEIINNYFCNVKMNISRRLIKRSNFILLSSNYFNHLIIR